MHSLSNVKKQPGAEAPGCSDIVSVVILSPMFRLSQATLRMCGMALLL